MVVALAEKLSDFKGRGGRATGVEGNGRGKGCGGEKFRLRHGLLL